MRGRADEDVSEVGRRTVEQNRKGQHDTTRKQIIRTIIK